MQSTIFALIAFGAILASVHCNETDKVSEYKITQSFNSLLRSYEVKGETNAPKKFTVRNEALRIGTKLHLLEDDRERYSAEHKLTEIMSTWTITDKVNGKEVGTVENKLRPLGSMMTANGAFGSYKIEGEVGTHSYTITKDGQKVAAIGKKILTLRDTYDLTVYGETDRALMVLFTIIVNEIREH